MLLAVACPLTEEDLVDQCQDPTQTDARAGKAGTPGATRDLAPLGPSRPWSTRFALGLLVLPALFVGTVATAANLTVNWTAPTQKEDNSALTNLSGFRIYYRLQSQTQTGSKDYSNVVEVPNPNATSFTLTGLTEGQTYCVAVTAVTTTFFESDFSAEACAVAGAQAPAQVPQAPSNSESSAPSGNTDTAGAGGRSSGGGGCFIATAAFGSPMHPYVASLRTFREAYLRPFAPGRAFIRWYERIGPPLAVWLNQHPDWKPVVRLALWPAVGVGVVTVQTTGTQKLAVLLASGIAVAVAVASIRRRRKSYRTRAGPSRRV